MADILIATLYGFLGGLLRSIVGLLKLKNIKKEFNLVYMMTTLALAAVIGALIAFAFETNTLLYLAIGYAGTDLLQGLAKAGTKIK